MKWTALPHAHSPHPFVSPSHSSYFPLPSTLSIPLILSFLLLLAPSINQTPAFPPIFRAKSVRSPLEALQDVEVHRGAAAASL